MYNIPTSSMAELGNSISQLWSDFAGLFILALGLPLFFLVVRIILKTVFKDKRDFDDITVEYDDDIDDNFKD